MAVPDNYTFRFTDVKDELSAEGDNVARLSQAFLEATQSYFDNNYKEQQNELTDFRNYGPKAPEPDPDPDVPDPPCQNRSIDIVFLMDNSGSMSVIRDGLVEGLSDLVASMDYRYDDYRLALVSSPGNFSPAEVSEVTVPFALNNQAELIQGLEDMLFNGSIEPLDTALIMIANQEMGDWRPNADKLVFIYTDDEPRTTTHEDAAINLVNAGNSLNAQGVISYAMLIGTVIRGPSLLNNWLPFLNTANSALHASTYGLKPPLLTERVLNKTECNCPNCVVIQDTKALVIKVDTRYDSSGNYNTSKKTITMYNIKNEPGFYFKVETSDGQVFTSDTEPFSSTIITFPSPGVYTMTIYGFSAYKVFAQELRNTIIEIDWLNVDMYGETFANFNNLKRVNDDVVIDYLPSISYYFSSTKSLEWFNATIINTDVFNNNSRTTGAFLETGDVVFGSNFNLSELTGGWSLFKDSGAIEFPPGSNLKSLEVGSNMFDNSDISAEQYSQLLINTWNVGPDNFNVTLLAIGVAYNSSAVTARNGLINQYGWIITGDYLE